MKGISARLRVGVQSVQDSGGLPGWPRPLVRLLLDRRNCEVRGGSHQQVLGPLGRPLLLCEVPLLQSEGRKYREVEDRLQHQRLQQDSGVGTFRPFHCLLFTSNRFMSELRETPVMKLNPCAPLGGKCSGWWSWCSTTSGIW